MTNLEKLLNELELAKDKMPKEYLVPRYSPLVILPKDEPLFDTVVIDINSDKWLTMLNRAKNLCEILSAIPFRVAYIDLSDNGNIKFQFYFESKYNTCLIATHLHRDLDILRRDDISVSFNDSQGGFSSCGFISLDGFIEAGIKMSQRD